MDADLFWSLARRLTAFAWIAVAAAMALDYAERRREDGWQDGYVAGRDWAAVTVEKADDDE